MKKIANMTIPIAITGFIMLVFLLQFLATSINTPLKKSITQPYVESHKELQLKKDGDLQSLITQQQLGTLKQDKEKAVPHKKKPISADSTFLRRHITTSPLILGSKTQRSLQIPITTKVQARLIESLSNANYATPVHAVILEDLVIANKKYALKGGKLKGKFYAIKQDDRLYLRFHHLYLQGKRYSINAVAFDYDNQRGLLATVDHKVPQRLLKGLVETAKNFLDSYQTESFQDLQQSASSTVSALTLENIETQRLLSVKPTNFQLFFDDELKIDS